MTAMKESIFFILLIIVVTNISKSSEARRKQPCNPTATDREYLVKLQRRESQELLCLRRVDRKLTSKWIAEILKKVSLRELQENDYGSSSLIPAPAPSKPKYDNNLQEWLMESGSPVRKILNCFRKVAKDVAPLLNGGEIRCLNGLFTSHLEKERNIEKGFAEYLGRSSHEELFFRKFLSFSEFNELMFQNRNRGALGEAEKSVFNESLRILSYEKNKDKKTYTMTRMCEWKNLEALSASENSLSQFREFESQVYKSLNNYLASALAANWKSGSTISHEIHDSWMKTRENMRGRLAAEIRILRTLKKGAAWLCEYADKLGQQFFREQYASLRISTRQKSSSRTEKIADIVGTFSHINDARDLLFHKEVEEDSKCLTAFSEMVRNHQRFSAALAFVNNRYTYPELLCRSMERKSNNFKVIETTFCHCIGSFCAVKSLGKLFSDDYRVVEGKNGIHRIVSSILYERNKKVD